MDLDAIVFGGASAEEAGKNLLEKSRSSVTEGSKSPGSETNAVDAACNRLVTDYLLEHCYKESAASFSSKPLASHVVEGMDKRSAVRKLLQAGDVQTALRHADDLLATIDHGSVAETMPGLYFRLGCQHFVELVRAHNFDDALTFAQQTLGPVGRHSPADMTRLQDVATLLAYEDPTNSPVGSLMAESARDTLAQEVNRELYAATCGQRDGLAAKRPVGDPAASCGLETFLRHFDACGRISSPAFTLETHLASKQAPQ